MRLALRERGADAHRKREPSDPGAGPGEHSATRETGSCACRSPRIGPPASTSATPATSAKQPRSAVPPDGRTLDDTAMRRIRGLLCRAIEVASLVCAETRASSDVWPPVAVAVALVATSTSLVKDAPAPAFVFALVFRTSPSAPCSCSPLTTRRGCLCPKGTVRCRARWWLLCWPSRTPPSPTTSSSDSSRAVGVCWNRASAGSSFRGKPVLGADPPRGTDYRRRGPSRNSRGAGRHHPGGGVPLWF